MASTANPAPPSKLIGRVAVIGMALATAALGALALWAAIITQNGAAGLSQAGVQTSGHLRASQALSMLDTSTDALEEKPGLTELLKLRRSQQVLDDAFARMARGDIPEARRIAAEAQPLVERLKPAIEMFLTVPPTGNARIRAEEEMEDAITPLQLLLNDLDPDPSRVLGGKLEAVTASERLVRRTAYVLIPLGLGGVAACGWLLSVYRRRSEATMGAALNKSAGEARTDELTDLHNRRALFEELDRRFAEKQRFTLALADLNGFKRYNDTFGHPAGDALLQRVAHALEAACAGRGIAARLGGDEFCAVLDGAVPTAAARSMMESALSEEGQGFTITATAGVAAVPRDGTNPSAVLACADSRMYAAKVDRQSASEQPMAAVMARMLDEHHAGLGGHVAEVADLALACAETLGLSAADAAAVRQAAALHDIGKVAIPSAILDKGRALDAAEWECMRGHSVIGERILGGVPSLARVARMVRASHERWDGNGYPDGLMGDEIPLGARIIFVADSFCAMTEDRPYAAARSRESACQELRACAGTQFDPAVVNAFLVGFNERPARADRATALAR